MDGQSSTWKRRLRGAIGNALVWGGGFAALGASVFTALKVSGFIYAPMPWLLGLEITLKLGLFGAISGGAFAAVIRFAYQGRRLADINWKRFALTAGVATGIFVPLFMQTMNVISGDGMVPWGDVLDDGVLLSVFGAIAAGASLKLAQRVTGGGDGVDAADASIESLGDSGERLGLPQGEGAAATLAPRERSKQR
ncbi:MAG: hypothetical protein U0164_22315 [Gemmatimonadaceae bacterium]